MYRRSLQRGSKKLRAGCGVQAVERLTAHVDRLQNQIATLATQQVQLREEAQALRDCLSASGALPPASFQASMHRRRFAEVLQRHPGAPWPGTLDLVLHAKELALTTAAYAGAASVVPLAGTSRSLRCGVGCLVSELVALFPSQVYALGGVGDASEVLDSVERFDSMTCSWHTVAPLPEPRESCAAVAAGGSLLVLGGMTPEAHSLRTVAKFAPEMRDWEEMVPMICGRGTAAAVAIGSHVYAIGGHDGFRALDSVERLDLSADESCRWELQPPLHGPRFGHAASTLHGQAFVLGGKNSGRALNTVEKFEVGAESWQMMQPLHARRHRPAAASAHGRIYVVGGCDDSLPSGLRSVESFDPESGAWTAMAPLQVSRWGAAAVFADDSMLVMGGRNSQGVLASVERFDFATCTWELLPPLRFPRRYCCAAACRG